MFSKEILAADEDGLELVIERKCIALGLNVDDPTRVQLFAQELLRNLDSLRQQAIDGDRAATLKVEIYGLSMLMHRTNTELLGPGYLAQIVELSKQERTWSVIALAIWRELAIRNQ